LKELTIAEPGISTRVADTTAAAFKRGRCTRDFFFTTVAAANRTLLRSEIDVSRIGELHLGTRSSDHPSSSQAGVVLALQRNIFGARESEKTRLKMVRFPHDAVIRTKAPSIVTPKRPMSVALLTSPRFYH
jgi:hypothetical protein